MTEPAPLPTDPLLTAERLGGWAQESPLTDPAWASIVIDAVSTALRDVGNAYWTLETLPTRVRDIGYFVARNYYLNPDLIRQESVGPLQETRDNKVLQGIEFTDSQRAEIIRLAGAEVTGPVDGLWAMSFTRGPVETGQRNSAGNVVIWDTRGGWPIEYLDGEEAVVFDDPVI